MAVTVAVAVAVAAMKMERETTTITTTTTGIHRELVRVAVALMTTTGEHRGRSLVGELEETSTVLGAPLGQNSIDDALIHSFIHRHA